MTTPEQFYAMMALQHFATASLILAGAVQWWRQDSEEEDKTLADAADYILKSVMDPTLFQQIERETGQNIREQLTPEEYADLMRHRDLLRMGKRRN